MNGLKDFDWTPLVLVPYGVSDVRADVGRQCGRRTGLRPTAR